MTSAGALQPKEGVERGGDTMDRAYAASVLRWWADAGVDTIVDEAPRDWLRPRPAPAPPMPEPAPREPAPTPHDHAWPDQLDLFQVWLRDMADLPFAAPGAPRLCPAGDPASGLMILSDMPAAADCAAGSLLAGDAGRLFDRMLKAIGRDRASIYLAAVSCLRAPTGLLGGEQARCAALARHHVGLAAPEKLLIFGDGAAKALLGLPVVRARGRWHRLETPAGHTHAIASYSPDFLLGQPSAKAHAWADLQLLLEGPPR